MTRTIISEQGIDVHSISNEVLLNEIHIRVGNINPIRQKITLKNHCPKLFNELIKRTSFLDEHYPDKQNIPFKARLYCLKNNLTSHPICQHPKCSNPVKWNGNCFLHHCCVSCSSADPNVQTKLENTNIKIRGVKRPSQSEEVQLKTMQTNISRRGVPFPQQAKEVREKSVQTSLKNHGTNHPMQCQEVKDILKQAMLDKHGVEHQSQLQWVKDKRRKTTKENHGVECMFLDVAVIAKRKNTLKENYGVEYPFQSKEIRDRSIKTMNERYNVDYYVQSIEFIKSLHKPYVNEKYPTLKFGSKWEFEVYDFLTERNVSFEYQPIFRIPYVYCNTIHHYHPDFIVKGRIVEVKGDHFFKKNADGKEIMICPYGYNKFSPEEYEWWCGLYEAKH